jgi:DNA-binding XRE family transcriptional regulator
VVIHLRRPNDSRTPLDERVGITGHAVEATEAARHSPALEFAVCIAKVF